MEIKIIASGSTGNATKISDGTSSLLLDAGINIKRLQSETGFTISSVAGCFVTHAHQDHCKAVKDLAKLGVNIYSSRGTFGSLGINGHRHREMKSLETITVGTFKVMAFDVVHDAEEPLGFLVESTVTGEKLLYFSDTAYVKYTFKGLTHIIAECNHGERELRKSVRDEVIDKILAKRIVQNHMSLERFIEFLKANDTSRVKQVYLIHLSDNNSNSERFKQAVQQITGTEVYVY